MITPKPGVNEKNLDYYHTFLPFHFCRMVYLDQVWQKTYRPRNDPGKTGRRADRSLCDGCFDIQGGTQNITMDEFGGSYRLRESGRKIETYDATNATDLTTNGFLFQFDSNQL